MNKKPPSNLFSASMIRSFTMCHYYFYLAYEKGLVPFGAKPSPKTEFGTAFHLAMQLIDSGTSVFDAEQKAIAYLDPNQEQPFISKAGNEIAPLYCNSMLVKIIREYLKFYQHDKSKVWENQVEVGLVEEIIPGIFYSGRIDKIVLENLGLRAGDYKTTKALSTYIYNPHDQLTGYQWLMQKTFGNSVGVLFDMIGIAKSSRTFHREPVTYTKERVKTWEESTKWHIEEIYACRDKNFWPSISQKCSDYFTPCQYLPICTAYDEVSKERLVSCCEVKWYSSYDINLGEEEIKKIEGRS